MKTDQARVTIRLRCTEFPGRNFDGKKNIMVGVQKGDDVVDEVFGDAVEATFGCELRVERNAKTGKPNFLGPYAHGTPQERFLYLSWGRRVGGGWHGFRRAKIHLRHLDWPVVEKAIAADRPIEAVVKLTDAKGGPLCAAVKPDHIAWSL
jgi:hypothetical protein